MGYKDYVPLDMLAKLNSENVVVGLRLVLQLFYASCCNTRHYKYPLFFLSSEVTIALSA